MLLKSLLVSVFFYFVCIIFLFIDSQNSTHFDADVGIIYGNKIELNGRPSARLEARLRSGVYLYKSNIIKKLIVSGGIGKEGYDEAKVMANYLIEYNVKQEDIILDSNGYNTNMTSINAFKLISSDVSVVAISQTYHVSRAKMSLRHIGFTKVYGFSSDYTELRDYYAYLREVMAWFKYWLLDL